MKPRRRFFHELTPFAGRIRQLAAATPPLSVAKDVPAIMDKRQAKLQRRADAARKAGQL